MGIVRPPSGSGTGTRKDPCRGWTHDRFRCRPPAPALHPPHSARRTVGTTTRPGTGGRGTLIGPVIACVALQAMVTQLGAQHTVDTGLVLGVILILFVLLIPRGLAPTVADATRRLVRSPKEQA